MISREEYDKKIEDLKTKLGDSFSLVSDTIAELSTDYDTVIQMDLDYKSEIENLKNEKVQLLETNNKLFTQVTNSNKEGTDPIFKSELDKKEQEDKIQDVTIDDVLDEKGGLN